MPGLHEKLHEIKRQLFTQAWNEAEGNAQAAAEILDITPRHALSLANIFGLKKHGKRKVVHLRRKHLTTR